MTISSQEKPIQAWKLLLCQKQDFFLNHLARDPISLNQQGTMEMWGQVFSGIGAQNIDTSWNELSKLENLEFHWLRGSSFDHGRSLPTRHTHSLHPFHFQRFWDGLNDRKPNSTRQCGGQREITDHKSSPWLTQPIPCVAAESVFWNKSWKPS